MNTTEQQNSTTQSNEVRQCAYVLGAPAIGESLLLSFTNVQNTTIQASCFNLSKSTTLFTKNTHQTQESQVPVTPIWSLKLFTKKSFNLVERKFENRNHKACSVELAKYQIDFCYKPVEEAVEDKLTWLNKLTTKTHRFIKAIA